ncbi:MAG: NAD(P)/FAD-dependent oxidoreductase [Pseudomonadota bacterium]
MTTGGNTPTNADRYDAIVIGAGHNGLIAATRLAKFGKRVLVLEARSAAGGMLGGDRPLATLPFGLRPEIEAALGLAQFGLRYEKPLNTIALGGAAPILIDGAHVDGVEKAVQSAYGDLHGQLTRYASALGGMLLQPPPRFRDGDRQDAFGLAKLGLAIRGLGKTDMRELLRIILSNVWDLSEDTIGDGPLAGALAMDATLGSAMAPRSPGTVLSLLYRMAARGAGAPGRRALPKGGTAALVDALTKAATAADVEIRLNTPVSKILVSDKDSVEGVTLQDGGEARAPLVLSNAAPRTTLIDLLGVDHLDSEMVRRIRNMATRGMVARIDFELSEPPDENVLVGGNKHDRIVIAPDMRYVERAFNAAKYGDLPPRPALEGIFSETPSGWRFSATAQYAPHDVNSGWTTDTRATLEASVTSVLDDAMPGFASNITDQTLTTPNDIEAAYAVTGGHWHHGELRIDQMLMVRPFHGASQYNMPVNGLYLCGAGAHPGGDISGAPGWNAAGRILKERG